MHSEPTVFLSPPGSRPDGGSIVWTSAGDGMRIRCALWPCDGAKGTVLILNGRADFIEKYGLFARELAAEGYATATLDWRGQGLSERTNLSPANWGHVEDFAHYQDDLAAFLDVVTAADMPEPLFLLAHSTGGLIGLRAIVEGFTCPAAVFSAPLWGLPVGLGWQFGIPVLGTVLRLLGRHRDKAPTVNETNYLLSTTFEDNSITSDKVNFDFTVQLLRENPMLALAGPTSAWVHEAHNEMADLKRTVLPEIPTLVTVGDLESVVSPLAIRSRVNLWPSARLIEYENCKHEIMIEAAPVRRAFLAEVTAHFDANL